MSRNNLFGKPIPVPVFDFDKKGMLQGAPPDKANIIAHLVGKCWHDHDPTLRDDVYEFGPQNLKKGVPDEFRHGKVYILPPAVGDPDYGKSRTFTVVYKDETRAILKWEENGGERLSDIIKAHFEAYDYWHPALVKKEGKRMKRLTYEEMMKDIEEELK